MGPLLLPDEELKCNIETFIDAKIHYAKYYVAAYLNTFALEPNEQLMIPWSQVRDPHPRRF